MSALSVVIDWSDQAPPEHLLTFRERRCAERFPPWRRREWATGRLTAHVALLLHVGRFTRHWDVLPDVTGAPRVSAPWTLSLSHKDSTAACAIHAGAVGLGIDVETEDAGNARAVRKALAPGEPPPPAALATLVWSCKEAAYKAFRGVPGRLRDYHVSLRAPSVHAHGRRLPVWSTSTRGMVVAVVSPCTSPPHHLELGGDEAVALLEGGSS